MELLLSLSLLLLLGVKSRGCEGDADVMLMTLARASDVIATAKRVYNSGVGAITEKKKRKKDDGGWWVFY